MTLSISRDPDRPTIEVFFRDALIEPFVRAELAKLGDNLGVALQQRAEAHFADEMMLVSTIQENGYDEEGLSVLHTTICNGEALRAQWISATITVTYPMKRAEAIRDDFGTEAFEWQTVTRSLNDTEWRGSRSRSPTIHLRRACGVSGSELRAHLIVIAEVWCEEPETGQLATINISLKASDGRWSIEHADGDAILAACSNP